METSTLSKCRLYTWGANSYGQLGQGHIEDLANPLCAETSHLDQGVTFITGGGGHSVLITGSGSLLGCGQNHKGQLGLGHTTDVLSFVPISLPRSVQQVTCGWDFTLILTDGGQVLSCGSNAFGQLGVSPQVPYSAKALPVQCDPCVSIAAGLRHALAVTCSGVVYQWGTGLHSQAKRCQRDLALSSYLSSKEPCVVPGLDHVVPVKVAAGSAYSVCLTAGGEVLMWGSNKHGQLVHADSFLLLPVALDRSLFNGGRVTHIHSGWTHLVALTERGQVFSWGRGNYGQLGRAVPANQGTDLGSEAGQTESLPMPPHCTPTEISELAGARQIACGSEHNLAIVGDCVFSWGWNEHGMCGDGSLCDVTHPRPIPALRGTRALLIGSGAGHSMALCCLKDGEEVVGDCSAAVFGTAAQGDSG